MNRFRPLMVVALAASAIVLGVTRWADAKNKCRPICRQPATCCAPQATCCQPQPSCCASQMGSSQVFPSTVDVTYCATSGFCEWFDEMSLCQYASYYAEDCDPGVNPPILFDAACGLTAPGCPIPPALPNPDLCITISRSLVPTSLGIPADTAKRSKLSRIPANPLRPLISYPDPSRVHITNHDSFVVTVGGTSINAVGRRCWIRRPGQFFWTLLGGRGHEIRNVPPNAPRVNGTKVSDNVLKFRFNSVEYQIVTNTAIP